MNNLIKYNDGEIELDESSTIENSSIVRMDGMDNV